MSNKSPRRRSREFALQALYGWQINQQSWSDIDKQFAVAEGFDKADAALFKSITKGVIAEIDALTVAITPHLDRSWAEVSPVEKAVMLIGAYELSHTPETPYRVIINEAIELAKSFGGTDGHKYVNGVLDKYAVAVRAEEVGDPPLMKARVTRKSAAPVVVTTKVTKKIVS